MKSQKKLFLLDVVFFKKNHDFFKHCCLSAIHNLELFSIKLYIIGMKWWTIGYSYTVMYSNKQCFCNIFNASIAFYECKSCVVVVVVVVVTSCCCCCCDTLEVCSLATRGAVWQSNSAFLWVKWVNIENKIIEAIEKVSQMSQCSKWGNWGNSMSQMKEYWQHKCISVSQ